MSANLNHSTACVLLVLCASCSGQRTVVEDRGPLVVADSTISNIAWLASGEEIAYVSAASELIAVRIADGVRRQLDPAPAYFATGLARSRNGSALYFIAQDLSTEVPRYTLREALTHTDAGAGEVILATPAVSSDGRRVLYWTTNGPSVLDVSGVVFSISNCSPWPVPPVFSPLADHVLCAGENPVVITLADASAQLTPTTDSFSWRAVCWNESGPQAVALLAELKHERVYLVDVVAAEMHALYEPTEGLLDFSEAAISNDGRFVSFWETECLRSASLFSCEPGQSEARLKVVEVSSGRSVTVASGGAGPGPISFSDDGTQIAYLFVGATGALHMRAFR